MAPAASNRLSARHAGVTLHSALHDGHPHETLAPLRLPPRSFSSLPRWRPCPAPARTTTACGLISARISTGRTGRITPIPTMLTGPSGMPAPRPLRHGQHRRLDQRCRHVLRRVGRQPEHHLQPPTLGQLHRDGLPGRRHALGQRRPDDPDPVGRGAGDRRRQHRGQFGGGRPDSQRRVAKYPEFFGEHRGGHGTGERSPLAMR